MKDRLKSVESWNIKSWAIIQRYLLTELSLKSVGAMHLNTFEDLGLMDSAVKENNVEWGRSGLNYWWKKDDDWGILKLQSGPTTRLQMLISPL